MSDWHTGQPWLRALRSAVGHEQNALLESDIWTSYRSPWKA